MNETVTIKEGGLTRRLAPIDKLKVNTTDNKDSTWVSAGKTNTGVLHASENGIYIASEDGYEAYSEVIVRVTKDSFDGDTSFDDWDYETPDMDLDNWDPETTEEFENDPDGFNDIFNNEDEWKDIDKPIDIKMDNPKIQDTKISGIDPISGNPMEVGLDENGFLTEKTLPSAIKIEVPPTKTEYTNGEIIDYTGIRVYLLDANNQRFTNEDYPTGEIPFDELMFPVTTASGEESGTASSDLVPKSFSIGKFYAYNEWSVGGGAYRYTKYKSEYFPCMNTYKSNINTRSIVFASKSQNVTVNINEVYMYVDKDGNENQIRNETAAYQLASEYTHNNKIAYYYVFSNNGEYIKIEPSPTNIGSNENYGAYAWTMLYGDTLSNNNIPVQWMRSDGEVLEDSFTIEVLPDPDGAHPQVDPSTVEWNHRRYKANEELGAVEVRHGSVYMEGGAIYDVGAAVRLGMLEPVDNEIVP